MADKLLSLANLLTWANLKSKPNTFPPSTHAASHAAAGSDPVTIAESQVTNLVSDLASLSSGKQPLDSDLTAIAALSTTTFGRSLLALADAAALRSSGGLVIGTDVQAYDAKLTNTLGYALSGLTSPSIIETDLRNILTQSAAMASAQPLFTYFVPDNTLTISNLISVTRGTAAGATPTLCKMGTYSVDGSDNLTCIARTANNTALWAATNTVYTQAIADNGAASPGAISSVTLTKGQRYAFAFLIVTAAALPVLNATACGNGPTAFLAPRIASSNASSSDLATSYTAASLFGVSSRVYGRGT